MMTARAPVARVTTCGRRSLVVRAAGSSSSAPPKPLLLSEIPAAKRVFSDREWEMTLETVSKMNLKQAVPAAAVAPAAAAVTASGSKQSVSLTGKPLLQVDGKTLYLQYWCRRITV